MANSYTPSMVLALAFPCRSTGHGTWAGGFRVAARPDKTPTQTVTLFDLNTEVQNGRKQSEERRTLVVGMERRFATAVSVTTKIKRTTFTPPKQHSL
ncbi:MAG: hypothetical protein AAGF95_26540 [Chloroflexota bacterium]